jgi:hypothetical protein
MKHYLRYDLTTEQELNVIYIDYKHIIAVTSRLMEIKYRKKLSNQLTRILNT